MTWATKDVFHGKSGVLLVCDEPVASPRAKRRVQLDARVGTAEDARDYLDAILPDLPPSVAISAERSRRMVDSTVGMLKEADSEEFLEEFREAFSDPE